MEETLCDGFEIVEEEKPPPLPKNRKLPKQDKRKLKKLEGKHSFKISEKYKKYLRDHGHQELVTLYAGYELHKNRIMYSNSRDLQRASEIDKENIMIEIIWYEEIEGLDELKKTLKD